MSMNYTKLESIHCALQELQQEFNIPDDHEHLENAFKFTEDLREEQFKQEGLRMKCELCNGVGWIDTFNTEDRVQEIQKCDDCNIFKDDEQARQEV